jgi:hypothetical protein
MAAGRRVRQERRGEAVARTGTARRGGGSQAWGGGQERRGEAVATTGMARRGGGGQTWKQIVRVISLPLIQPLSFLLLPYITFGEGRWVRSVGDSFRLPGCTLPM